MILEETKQGGVQYFRFVHSAEYQQIQFQFLDAVNSLQPEAIMVSFPTWYLILCEIP